MYISYNNTINMNPTITTTITTTNTTIKIIFNSNNNIESKIMSGHHIYIKYCYIRKYNQLTQSMN